MSAKRFKLDSEVGFIDTQKCGEDTITLFEVVVELNKLNEENEQLKLQNKQYSMMVNANSDLNDEIYEQLQKTEKNYKSLIEENEQLKQSIDTRMSVEDNYRKHLEIYSDQYFKLKEYINELLTKKYNHYEEMKKTIQNKEAQRIYTNILKVIKELQEDVDTEWGS